MRLSAGQKSIPFQKFRFQILPTAKDGQLSLFSTVEELKKVKNELFADVLIDQRLSFSKPKSDLKHKIEFQQDAFYIFKIGTQKLLSVENINFEKEQVVSYPNVCIIIDNRPNRQLIFIEDNRKAFTSPLVVASLFANTLNRFLRTKDLSIFISPVFNEKEFWQKVLSFQFQIEAISFEFIRPNMADISKALDNNIKKAQADFNATKAKIEFKAPPKGSLDVTQENETVNGLMDYVSKGGGEVSFKAKNIRKRITTKDTNVIFDIKEASITGTATDVADFLTKLGNDHADN